MSIEDMRAYLKNSNLGVQGANAQVALLETQKTRLAEEAKYLKLRQEYVDAKIGYWKAVSETDTKRIDETGKKAYAIAKELKLPQRIDKNHDQEDNI